MSTEKKKIVPTDSAFPSFAEIQEDRENDKLLVHGFDGMDIRTKIATDLMAGILASNYFGSDYKWAAKNAVSAADYLIEALNEEKHPGQL